jgi:hypothetical protein
MQLLHWLQETAIFDASVQVVEREVNRCYCSDGAACAGRQL